MASPIAITGLGVVSPLGNSVDALARRFIAGEDRRARATEDREDEGPLEIGEIPLDAVPSDKRARIGRLDRLCRAFLAASFLAVDDARLELEREDGERVGLSFGTGLGCLLTNAEYNMKVVEHGPAAASPRLFAYTVSSAAAGEVSIAMGIKGPNATVHVGLAAGLGAVGYGSDLIRMGKADVVLAGGADVIGPALLQGLRDMRLLKSRAQSVPFRNSTPGVWPSEGAVVAVLERAERAERRGARFWGCIDAYAAGFEPSLTRRKAGVAGMVGAMRRALRAGGLEPGDIDLVLASAHGTPLDDVEQRAMNEVFGRHQPEVRAPKALLGESFGAGGVLAMAVAAALMRTSPPAPRRRPAAMVNALCYAGSVVSLILGCEA